MPPSKRLKVHVKEDDRKDEGSLTIDQPGTSKDKISDWRDDKEKYRQRHVHALKQGILTDVNFTVGPGRTHFAAHKVILALASPVFEAMFYGSLKETEETINIPDLTSEGFKSLLDFVYSDDAHFDNETDAFSALFAADKYCMPYMKDVCNKYLTTLKLTKSNIWPILENALFLESEPIVDKCLAYLKVNIKACIETPGFLEISNAAIKSILLLDLLLIPEILLLESIVKWGKEKVKNGADESLKELLEPFLKYIRFGCIAQIDLVAFLDEHSNVISDKDAVAILKYMTDTRLYSLPEWCSTNVHSRNPREINGGFVEKACRNIRSYALSARQNQHNSEHSYNFQVFRSNSDGHEVTMPAPFQIYSNNGEGGSLRNRKRSNNQHNELESDDSSNEDDSNEVINLENPSGECSTDGSVMSSCSYSSTTTSSSSDD